MPKPRKAGPAPAPAPEAAAPAAPAPKKITIRVDQDLDQQFRSIADGMRTAGITSNDIGERLIRAFVEARPAVRRRMIGVPSPRAKEAAGA